MQNVLQRNLQIFIAVNIYYSKLFYHQLNTIFQKIFLLFSCIITLAAFTPATHNVNLRALIVRQL